MSSAISRDLKKFETNSVPQSEIIWNRILCLEKTWIMNSFSSLYKVMVSTVTANITCLDSQLTITRIVLQLNEKKSFSIKFIEIKF